MLLTDIKSYMVTRRRVSLDDLGLHFTVEPNAMRGLMETWIAKGRARRIGDQLPCGTCGKCESATTEIYEWLDDKAAVPRQPCGH